MGSPASTPTLPYNRGRPIQLQKLWAKMTEYRFPVRMNTKAAKKPNREVYVNWKSERTMAISSGVRGLVRRNS